MGDTKYEFVDLMPFVRVNQLDRYYGAASQLELLADAFDVHWIVKEMEDDWQGEWNAVFILEGRYHIMNGYFGSCSGCDDLEDENPMDWLRDYVKNVRAFDNVDDLIHWLTNTDDYSYRDMKSFILLALEEERLSNN